MEALCCSPVRKSPEMIDSSCKSHITDSEGLLSHNVSNHTERSWHPQVRQPLNPSLNYAYDMTDFPGNFSKHPTVVTLICHEPNEPVYVYMCTTVCLDFCMPFSVCVFVNYTHIREKADASVSGDGDYILASHTCGSWSKYTLHRGWNLNICRSSTSKVPKQGAQSLGGRPKSAQSHLFCVSLTFCLSYMNVFSPHLPSLHTLSSPCPSFLVAVEVTFINGEFMCMTASKPELWLHRPWRLSVNSCNHQSAKYLPFRAHQLCTPWLRVIYWIKNISSSADLHWYWYSVIFSWNDSLPCTIFTDLLLFTSV